MKNKLIIIVSVFFFISCQQKVAPADVVKINGYWEIEKVVLADGKEKDYKINETFDYFEIKNNKGFRKKGKPQFDGTFLATDASENVAILAENGKVYLNYTTLYAKWKEELKAITDDKMILENKEKIEYHYKKAAPINLDNDGEKIK